MYRVLGHFLTHIFIGILSFLGIILVLSCFVPLVRYCLRWVFYPHYTLEDFLILKKSCPWIPIDGGLKFKSGKILEFLISESKYPMALKLPFKKIPLNMVYGDSSSNEILKWRLRIGK